ncbi:MAG: hypothetical protein JW882_13480 [Deltaproteobacteria bacterium]|nr:hypothetical protein [Deltaproteobacteria bacterium]
MGILIGDRRREAIILILMITIAGCGPSFYKKTDCKYRAVVSALAYREYNPRIIIGKGLDGVHCQAYYMKNKEKVWLDADIGYAFKTHKHRNLDVVYGEYTLEEFIGLWVTSWP